MSFSGMRALILVAALVCVFASLTISAQKNQTYSGEIMEGSCVRMGSHDTMMKSHPDMKTAEDCTLACVKAGSQYVLYDSSAKTIYQLDGQKKAKPVAGQKVTITGNLEADKTIRIVSIKAASLSSTPFSGR
jgi:hypothetical protein